MSGEEVSERSSPSATSIVRSTADWLPITRNPADDRVRVAALIRADRDAGVLGLGERAGGDALREGLRARRVRDLEEERLLGPPALAGDEAERDLAGEPGPDVLLEVERPARGAREKPEQLVGERRQAVGERRASVNWSVSWSTLACA